MKLHLPVALLTAVISAMSYGAEPAYIIDRTMGSEMQSGTYNDNDVIVNVTGGDFAKYNMGGLPTEPSYLDRGVYGAIQGASETDVMPRDHENIPTYGDIYLNVSGGENISWVIGEGVPTPVKVTGDKNINVTGGEIGYIVGGVNYASGTNGFTGVGNATTVSSKINEEGETVNTEAQWAHKDASNPDINISVTGGTVGQIRGGNNNKSDNVYNSLKYAQSQGTDLMTDKPWSVAGDVNISVGGDAVVGDGKKAIAGGGGSGHSVDGKVTVNVSGGTINGAIYGGTTNIYTEVASTEVNISGGTINGNVYGGGNYDDGASKATTYGLDPAVGPTVKGDTKVVLSGGTINGSVYAAGDKDIVEGNTHVVIDGTQAKVTGVISGGGVNGSDVEGDSLLTIQNSGGLGVSWNQIKDFNAVEIKNSQLALGTKESDYTLNSEFKSVSVDGSHIFGNINHGVQLNANNSKVEIYGNLTTTQGSTITNTSAPMTVGGNASFKGTTMKNADLDVTGNIDISGKTTIDGGSIVVGGNLKISNSNVAVDSLTGTDGNGVNLRFESTFNANSLTVGSDLVLSEGSAIYGSPFGSNSSITANSISSTGKVYISGGDVTATVGDINLKDSNINGNSGSGESNLVAVNGNVALTNTSLSHTNIVASNGVIALNGVTAKNTLNLTASTNGWSTITGVTTMDDVVLNSGKYQVKQDATLTADTITVNATTYLDGQTTANKLTANEDTYIRYNGANIGELTIDGASFAVSNGALVEVGQLTASNSLFGLDVSGTGTKVVVGDSSSDVHSVNNSRLTASNGAQLVVNGTLEGNRITVSGAVELEKVNGDNFRYTNTGEEYNLQVNSINGNNAFLDNKNGGISISKLETENGTVRATGDISLSTGSKVSNTELTTSEGNITLKGATLVDSTLTSTTGNIDISGKTTIDGGSIVVGGNLKISNSNVAVDSLTGTDGNGVNLRFESTFNANSLTVGSDLVLSEGSAIYGSPFGSNSSITANSISSTGKVYISGGEVTATVGDINLKDSIINGLSGSGESNLVAVNGNVALTNTSLSHTNIVASNGVIALNGVTANNTLNLTASTSGWSTITGETTVDDLVLVGGNLQVKKEATFTADTVTLNGQTYIDGTATINKVVANDYLSARVNDINIGELELNGDQLSVSYGAAVTVGTLTATGKSISVSDTTNYGSSQLIIGTDSASVHNVAGTRFAVNGESVLKVNGTLKGDGINVGGVAQIENVEGDRFRFTNTTTEGDLQVGSLTGTGAYFENRNGGVEIGKIVTENSTVKASGDITVGTGSVLTGSELNSSAGNITLTGTTATDTAIHAANGTVTLNDSHASTAAGMDAQKVVVGSGSKLDVTVLGLTLTGTGKTNDEAMVVDGTVNVTDSSLTIKGSNSQLGIGYGADGAVMNVTNSTVDLSEGTTLHMGYNANTSNSVLNIKNSQFVGGSNNAWLGGGTINVTDNSTLSVCTGADKHYNYRVLMGLSGNTVNLNVASGSDFVSSASQFVTNFNGGTTVNINVKGEGSTLVHNNEIESAPSHGITKTTTYLLDSGTDASGNKYDAVNNVKTNITASEGGSIAFNSDVTYVGSAQDKAAGYTDKKLNISVDSTSSMTFGDMVIYADTTIDNKGSFTVDDISVHDGATVENLGSLSLDEVVLSDATLYNAGELHMNSLVMDNATLLFAATAMDSCSGFIYNGADLTGYGISNVSAVDMIKEFGVVMSGEDAAGLLQQWGSEVEFSFTLAKGEAAFEEHFAYVLEQNKEEFTITLGNVAELSFADGEIKNITVEDTEEGVVVKGIAVIPEPTTATLSLLALAALAARRRRK